MDLAFEAVGKNGKFQIILIVLVVSVSTTTLIVSSGLPCLTIRPKVLCREHENILDHYTPCHLDKICAHPDKYDVIKDYSHSLDNFTMKYDLICDRSYYIAIFGSAFFLGAMFACIFLAPFPDKYGRLVIYKYLLIFNVFIQINFLFSINIYHVVLMSFLAGVVAYTSSVGTIIIAEFIDRKISGVIISVRSASFGIVGIMVTIFYMYVNSLKGLFIITTIISILIVVTIEKYLVESPRWLNAKNRLPETLNVLRHIATVNNSLANFNKFCEINSAVLNSSAGNLKVIKKSYSIIEIFNFKSQRNKMLLLIYQWFSAGFSFYGMMINLGRSEENMFMESIVTYGAEVISEILSGWLAGIFGRVKVLKILSFMGGVCFIAYYFSSDKFVRTILIFMSSFGFSGAVNDLYIYSPEVFPTSIRSVTVGFLFLTSRVAAMLIPILNKMIKQLPILCGAMSILGSYLCFYLEETLGKDLLDDIPEVKRGYSVLSTSSKNISKMTFSPTYRKSTESIVSGSYFRLSFEAKEPYFMKNENFKI
jgi:MFS family permease